MRAVTIKEAKARLNELIEAAERGEDVVLMRGSEHVAAIVPISAADLELAPRLTDAQAEALWRRIADERAAKRTAVFDDAAAAVAHLKGGEKASRRPGARPTATRKKAGSRR